MHTSPSFRIRPADESDREALRACICELQDAERAIDAALPPGEAMAEAYLRQIEQQAADWAGTVLVAERGGRVVGFVSVFTRVPFDSADDPPGTFALIGDLVVSGDAQRGGIGGRLLADAVRRATEAGAADIRVVALKGNAPAERLYAGAGFEPYLVTYRLRQSRESKS